MSAEVAILREAQRRWAQGASRVDTQGLDPWMVVLLRKGEVRLGWFRMGPTLPREVRLAKTFVAEVLLTDDPVVETQLHHLALAAARMSALVHSTATLGSPALERARSVCSRARPPVQVLTLPALVAGPFRITAHPLLLRSTHVPGVIPPGPVLVLWTPEGSQTCVLPAENWPDAALAWVGARRPL